MVIVQDLDKPRCAGAFWGEVRIINKHKTFLEEYTKYQVNSLTYDRIDSSIKVNSSVHKALGCVGTVIDGAVRSAIDCFSSVFFFRDVGRC